MANLVRSAKSGNDWTSNDLLAYNIEVYSQSSDMFFGYKPKTIPTTIDPDFLTATVPPQDNLDLSDETYGLLKHLDLATHAKSRLDAAIHDFGTELLRLLGFARA